MNDKKKNDSEIPIPDQRDIVESGNNTSETNRYPPNETQPLERKNYDHSQLDKKNE